MGRSVLPSILKFVLPPPPPPTPPPPTSSKANERAQSYRDVWGKKPVAPSASCPSSVCQALREEEKKKTFWVLA